MFKKRYRLNARDFTRTIEKGKSYKSKYFYLKTLSNDLGHTKIGVAVSKKLSKNAVQRNYYKRVLRHVLKVSLPHTNTNNNIILVGGENIKNKKFKELSQDAKDLFQKTNLF